jgi:RHS repeat-associated protein
LTSAQNAGTDCSKSTVNGTTEYWGNSYGYDAWGNLLQKTVTKCAAENFSVTALANNQLAGYGYDAAGNMTHDATSGLYYTYDQENRITGAAGYTYTYDADGNRVKKSNGSAGTLYWYMTPGIVAESDLSGNLSSEYVFFDGERVARKDFPGGAVSYYFSDHLKTTDIVTDAQGSIKNESDFYPWGGELQFSANDSNHYKFTGKERDSESGLDYFGARYYGSALGRFITPDWAAKATAVPYAEFADPQSLNLYSYVRNIPTTKYDADGHCPGDDCKNVKVTAEVDQKPKFQKNVELKDVNGKVVAKATGVSGQLMDTVTVNGKPQSGVKVTEKNQETHTVNGKEITNKLVEGKGSTNELGQIGDKIGTFNPTSGTKEDNNAIVKQLSTDAHTITDKQTLTLTLPNGCTCEATSTRTLTNVGPDGSGSAHYTLTTTQPVVTKADQPNQ